MSSYEEMHVLRLPFSKTDLGDTDWDIVEKMIKEKGLLYDITNPKEKGFEVQCTEEEFCLDYVLSRNGFSSGEFGHVRELNLEEKQHAKSVFDKLGIQYNIADIRFVHYCWYNCSEPPFYYELNNTDIFSM